MALRIIRPAKAQLRLIFPNGMSAVYIAGCYTRTVWDGTCVDGSTEKYIDRQRES